MMVAPRSTLLIGSIPLQNAEETFSTVATQLGDRLHRIPDGETGPRSDWIVWQYPVLNARPEFEVCPPDSHPYRSLPKLRLRDPAAAAGLSFGELGYEQSARFSYQSFARMKRDGVIPSHCRFQVALPTPLSPISAFIAPSDQAAIEPIYERRLLHELSDILDAIPHDQLAIQWDTNFEFAMLAGWLPSWFADVRAGVIERLLRLASCVPVDVELGYHFCHGHERPFMPHGKDVGTFVEVANALAASLSRPLNWLHLPLLPDRIDIAEYEQLALLSLRPETELYLGILHLEDGEVGANTRIMAAQRYVHDFGVATECGWGRSRPEDVTKLLALHGAVTRPIADSPKQFVFRWPAKFARVPDDPWTTQPVDEFGLAYDQVDQHGWYRNLDPTVDELVQLLKHRDILVDYSGGTGILVDRLKLRLFGAQVGSVIVDSSPKFLGVALQKFRNDPSVAFRHLSFLRDLGRLQRLDEVLGPPLDHGVDVIATTNAIHLYTDLEDTVAAWARVLRPGGTVLVNSGNIRNPRARPSDWILDETVWVLSDLAEGIVRTDHSFVAYRQALDDVERMKKHAEFRDRVFLEPRPLDFYVQALEGAGLHVKKVREMSIDAGVDDWYEFLTAYHDAVLGWVGGTERIDGTPPSDGAVEDRMRLLRQAMDLLFGGRSTFQTCWTYLTCRNEG
jgi:SAM-dependent methyltransferase